MSEKKQRVSLIGIGPGAPDMLTCQAKERIRKCDCLIGAQRMTELAKEAGLAAGVPVFVEYDAGRICGYIQNRKEWKNIAVLLSGDTGFYSGAKALTERLREEEAGIEVEVMPGLSSVAVLAARLKTGWEDAALLSLHGKETDFIQTVSRNTKTFLLLGGRDSGRVMLGRLKEYGMDHVTVCIGSRLSYPDERILTGKTGELKESDAEGLCAAMIWNPSPEKWAAPHLPDDAFIRGNVPMTKEEVRAVSISRLSLTEDAVVYDIGAGTGSVSVEAARCGSRIRVWAVEKNPEAAELLRQNRRKFKADGIRIVEGTAPDALQELEPPTHVFIGGSAGNLKEILRTVQKKNPDVRIVINAISLDTMAEIMEAEKEGLLREPEITCVSAARVRKLGSHHMMTAQNPVYIVSAGKGVPDGKKERQADE